MLERKEELAELAAAAREARDGDGSLVLIAGEAGIGKSSLVGALRTVLPAEDRLLVGYCDDLATPRVLGPLRDLVGSVGTALRKALESGDRHQVIDALRSELDRPNSTVLVIEDVHWADEATLDVLRYLARRIATLPAVLVLTYRDEEVDRDHRLAHLLGMATSVAGVRRLQLPRLSMEAVRSLGAGTGLDADQVYAATGGNPFLVTEVFAFGDLSGVPHSVTEAVRARLAALDPQTLDALEQLAVVPSAVERWLVEQVVPGGLAALAAAEQHGVLTVTGNRIAFQHELMRRAVVDSMPAVRRVARNHSVLAALLNQPHGTDLSRLVHHAAEAGDDEAVIRYGPAAAREAARAGSHREAVAHYQRVLEHRAAFAPAEQAGLLEEYAVECNTIGLVDLSASVQSDAVALRRELGDAVALGLALRWLSRIQWTAGSRRDAEARGAEATEVLTGAGDPAALALALSNQSQLHMLAGHSSESITVGERAAAMAREIGDAATLAHALTNVGISLWRDGDPQGEEVLGESLRVALEADEIEHACRAYVGITWHLIDGFRLDDAGRVLDDAIELAGAAELIGPLQYLYTERAMISLARCDWEDAERAPAWGETSPLSQRCPALVVQGRARVRRGQAGGEELLTEAWEIAKHLDEAQRIGPAGSALLEAAWLQGDASAATAEVAAHYEEVRRFGNQGCAAELGYWMRLAGTDAPMRESDHPYALMAAGQWRSAADFFLAAGCPYEYAQALTASSDPADLIAALSSLDELGAEPLARKVRLRLRELGVARLPRGPARTTRGNPVGLTGRQVDVVRLLAEGLTNAEIAARLVLSVRTVDTHVAAILDKLHVRTRRDAVAQAKDLGLLADRDLG